MSRWDPVMWASLLFRTLTVQRIRTGLRTENGGLVLLCHLLLSGLALSRDVLDSWPLSQSEAALSCLWLLSPHASPVCLAGASSRSHVSFHVASCRKCSPDSRKCVSYTSHWAKPFPWLPHFSSNRQNKCTVSTCGTNLFHFTALHLLFSTGRILMCSLSWNFYST